MSAPSPHDDWTLAWGRAAALGLSSWTVEPDALAEPAAACLLQSALELVVRGHRLPLVAYVVLPGALHVVGRWPRADEPSALRPWPVAFSQLKGLHARWDNRRRERTGPAWKPGARVRPIAREDLASVIQRVHRAPVDQGLAELEAEWPWSSWRAHAGGSRRAAPDRSWDRSWDASWDRSWGLVRPLE